MLVADIAGAVHSELSTPRGWTKSEVLSDHMCHYFCLVWWRRRPEEGGGTKRTLLLRFFADSVVVGEGNRPSVLYCQPDFMEQLQRLVDSRCIMKETFG